MRIATWNVNSVRSRLDRLIDWLKSYQPDAMCLQETKCSDENFPEEAISAAGYHCSFRGQGGYNGVAILTKRKPDEVVRGLQMEPGEDARALAVSVDGTRIACIYAPNGRSVGSDHYDYKLRWYDALAFTVQKWCEEGPLVLCGDTNVAVDDADVCHPKLWRNSVLCTPEVRSALQRVMALGLRDVTREHHPDGAVYTWWDYQYGAFKKNHGLRIDHILASPKLADKCSFVTVDREERRAKGTSDHAPVFADFS